MADRCPICDHPVRFVVYTDEDDRGQSHRVATCARHLAGAVNGLIAVDPHGYVTVEAASSGPARSGSTDGDIR